MAAGALFLCVSQEPSDCLVSFSPVEQEAGEPPGCRATAWSGCRGLVGHSS